MKMLLIGLLIGGLIGYQWGWMFAHVTVAAECKRLGGFFVGDEIFKCVRVDKKSMKGVE